MKNIIIAALLAASFSTNASVIMCKQDMIVEGMPAYKLKDCGEPLQSTALNVWYRIDGVTYKINIKEGIIFSIETSITP